MLTFRLSYFASLALGFAAAALIVPLRDVAAQARPRLEPRVAFKRLDSLETVALTGGTFRERLDAVTTITSIALGERIDDGNCVGGAVLSAIKYPGLVSRLSAIYQRSHDTALREAILYKMPFMVECAEAASFLAAAAEETPLERPASAGVVLHDDVRASLQAHAIGVLVELGASGETTLRRLHSQRSVRDSTARASLEALSLQGFRRPPKK